jgi:hypothetical protein
VQQRLPAARRREAAAARAEDRAGERRDTLRAGGGVARSVVAARLRPGAGEDRQKDESPTKAAKLCQGFHGD